MKITITIIVDMITEKAASSGAFLRLIAVCVDAVAPIGREVSKVGRIGARYLECLEQLSYLHLHVQVIAL